VGEAVPAVIVDVEPAIRDEKTRVSSTRSISLGLDRTTVPMAEPVSTSSALSRATRKSADHRRP
jgi:hypothetical protein